MDPSSELLKLLAGGGPSAVLLGFVLWKLAPALTLLASEITRLATLITVHANEETLFMARLDSRYDAILSNHLEHLPERVADELERRHSISS